MKRDLVNERQPFGVVREQRMHKGEGRPKEDTRKHLSATTERQNHGVTKHESFTDKNPNAYAKARAHGDFGNARDEFYWTHGKPKKGV